MAYRLFARGCAGTCRRSRFGGAAELKVFSTTAVQAAL